MDKILVTGSAGFIGSNVMKKLSGYEVVTNHNDSGRIDLQNIEQVMKLDSVDTVIHLAGKIPWRELSSNEFSDNNIKCTQNILEYSGKKNVKKIIYVSSYIYGKPKYCPVDEGHPVNPHTAYAESKYLAEKECIDYCKRSNLDLIILRPFNVYGESMRSGFLISNLINAVRSGKKLDIVNKDSKRDFLHVDDFVELILKTIDYNSKLEIFNVGSGLSYSFEDIITKIEKISKNKLDIHYDTDKNFIEDIVADISKIKSKLHWEPRIKIDDGLRKTFESGSIRI